nr:origin recognition complex subunit 3-like [Cherax quadricarinatus]
MATVSVSKGVFSFKRSKANKRKEAASTTLDYWTECDEDTRDRSYKNYVKCWQMVTNILHDLQSSVHAKVFEDLVHFIKNARKNCSIKASENHIESMQGQNDIPTACLVTGVNMPDHEAIFESLVRLLADGVTPHIAQLHSRDCNTLRSAMHKMITQLMGQNDLVDLDDEVVIGPSIKRRQINMTVLTSWYKECTDVLMQEKNSSKLRGSTQKATILCNDETCKAVTSPRKAVASPRKAVASPHKAVASPRKAVASPRKTVASPCKAVASPCKAVASPRKAATSLCKAVASPHKAVTSQFKAVASPLKAMASPHKAMVSPCKAVASPCKAVASPHKAMSSSLMAIASPHKTVGSSCKEMGSPSIAMKSFSNNGSPQKKIKLSKETSLPIEDDHQPLVVILEDVESFPMNVLHDLILICSEHHCDLPFVFVFGVATTPAAVHRSLSQNVSACIAMETFQAEPSTHFLNHVIEKVVMSDEVPFHIGGRPFKLLLDIFLYNDLSVKNFIKGLKLCMMQHFMNNSSAFLCCPAPERASVVRAMTPAQLDIIRKLPSFRSYVESCPPKEQAALLLEEKVCKATIRRLLNKLDCWYDCFCCLVKVVHALTSSLPQAPLGRQVREVLTTCLSHELVETEEFKEADKMLRLMAREELLPIVTNIIGILIGKKPNLDFSSPPYRKFLSFLGHHASVGDGQLVEKKKLFLFTFFMFSQKLLEIAKKKYKKPNAYESLRSEVLQLLINAFEQLLKPVNKQPLHEVLFFDSSSMVKRHLVGMPRAALTTALSNPHHYLQCECCQLEDLSSVVPTLPDVSVAYKLHLECGRLINLYDWLQAFISVTEPEEDTSSKRTIDQKLQARFAQAVSELQFLGFVKPTRRKTDHVARLTWGGC